MSAGLVARRYAKALMKVTGGDLAKSKVLAQHLVTLDELFENAEASSILCSPAMPTDLKKSLLDYGLKVAGAGNELKGFCDAVVEAGRVELLPQIISVFDELINDLEGVVDAHVRSATELTDADKAAIEGAVNRIVRKKVNLDTHIDKDLLGGFVVDVGNYKIDMSLKTKVEGLAQEAALSH